MRNPTNSLLAALVLTTLAVTAALGWAGWRLLDQQRAIDEQRTRDQIERVADAAAAGIRGKLAEAAERLSGWVSNPAASVPVIENAVVVGTRPDAVAINPAGGLPFVPVAPQAPRLDDALAPFEALEFDGALDRAIAGYRTLASIREPHVRARALVRLGRVQRKMRDLAGAVVTYQRLLELGAVPADDLPAELAALSGLRATYRAMSDEQHAGNVGQRILRGLDSGRWLILRGAAELYREPFSEPRPPTWRLADALSEVWTTSAALNAGGQRVFNAADSATPPVLVLWRSNDAATAAIAAFTDVFFAQPGGVSPAWQLIDAEGKVIGGRPVAPPRFVSRVIGDYPWTLHTWTDQPLAAPANTRGMLLAMMGAMLAFIWGGSYFMARAIRREAAVARLRSDFVAAVSHEFRSPLTAVRQMAEMLDDGRVTTDARRHTYYKTLAAEAARLQRLVETLLTFGRMEAGAQRYQFVDLDAAALVREVVGAIEPHAREVGKAIELEGPDRDMRVRADESALSVALRNLIDNAIKYSPNESTVWVRWRRDASRTAISVIDRGVGIPRSEQQRIFGKFVRGRAAIEANIRGTGIGLAIVQQIVTAHQGEIRLESEPGRGSTFTLLLPSAT